MNNDNQFPTNNQPESNGSNNSNSDEAAELARAKINAIFNDSQQQNDLQTNKLDANLNTNQNLQNTQSDTPQSQPQINNASQLPADNYSPPNNQQRTPQQINQPPPSQSNNQYQQNNQASNSQPQPQPQPQPQQQHAVGNTEQQVHQVQPQQGQPQQGQPQQPHPFDLQPNTQPQPQQQGPQQQMQTQQSQNQPLNTAPSQIPQQPNETLKNSQNLANEQVNHPVNQTQELHQSNQVPQIPNPNDSTQVQNRSPKLQQETQIQESDQEVKREHHLQRPETYQQSAQSSLTQETVNPDNNQANQNLQSNAQTQVPEPTQQPKTQPLQSNAQIKQPNSENELVKPKTESQELSSGTQPEPVQESPKHKLFAPDKNTESAQNVQNSNPNVLGNSSHALNQAQQTQTATSMPQQDSGQKHLTADEAFHEIGLDQPSNNRAEELVMNNGSNMQSWLGKLPFVGNKKKTPHNTDDTLPSPWKPLIRALIVGILAFGFLNSQIIVAQVKHFTNPTGQTDGPLLMDPTTDVKVSDEPRIVIPKINVNAPVVYDEKSYDEEKVQKALQRGVVHYGTTALPGEIGNNVIVGHSSANWWDSGEWKFAFVLLDKLEKGDTFEMHYESKRYVYKVTDKFITTPTDVSVLKQTDEPTATLITCNPPGSAWRRLIIKADQISPDPTQAKEGDNIDVPETLDSELPSDSPTLFDKISEWIF